MSDWPYDKMEDHEARAVARLTSEYQDNQFLRAMVSIFARRIQKIEDATYTLLTKRWFDGAEGIQLDRIGQIIGEARLGRSDESYKFAMETRITLNISGGEPERIIDYLVRIFGAEDVRYSELYPTKIQVFVDQPITELQAQQIRRIVPAGVGTVYVSTTSDDLPFGFSELTLPAPTDVDGFGEGVSVSSELELDDDSELELSDGSTLGVVPDVGDFEPLTEGGLFAELFEV